MKTTTFLRVCCLLGLLTYGGFFMADWLEQRAAKIYESDRWSIHIQFSTAQIALFVLIMALVPVYFIVLLWLGRPGRLVKRRAFNITSLLFILTMVLLFILNKEAWENYSHELNSGPFDIFNPLAPAAAHYNKLDYLLAAAVCLLVCGILALAGFVLLVKTQRRLMRQAAQ